MIDRIKQVIDYSQLSSSAFADTIGISRSGLTHLLTGRNQPSLDVARKILAKYPEISTEWLIMGMGEMLRPDEQPSIASESMESEITSDAYPPENSKFDRQTDLFREFENPANPETDMQEDIEIVAEHENNDNSVEVKDTTENVEAVVSYRHIQTETPSDTPRNVQTTVRKSSDPRPVTPMKRERRQTNNVSERKLQKIVFFYDDHSFEIYESKYV